MEAQELRLGNYVNCPKDGQNPFRIDLFDYVSNGIGKFGMIYDKNTHPLTWYLQDLKPIPLTEDWLLKFGWKHKKDFYLEINGFTIMFESTGNILSCFLEGIGIDILYIHQLQNLYFALTNEELIINQ
jgi:hypothetical protein